VKRQDVLQADLRAERHALAKAVRAGLCIGSTAVMLSISSVGLSQSSFSPVLELSALDGSDGFVINGIDSGDYSGRSVSGAGDINGDGVADVIIGASSAAPNGSFSGESYVVFGSGSVGSTGTIELSDLDGSNGFVINGIDASDFSGSSVSAAGDINDDGVADLIIGAAGADPNGNSGAGESYVLFGGSAVGTGGTFELSALDGTSGFVINGINSNDYSGEVCGAGDISGDNVADLIIGAPRAYSNGNYAAGQSYVVFGGDLVGSSAGLELSALDGSDGFVIDGIDFFDGSGSSVSGAGDINGDNVADLIIGTDVDTNFYPGATGESYVVFGGGGVGLTGEIDLSALDGSNGFVINGIGAGDASGGSVSDAGDVNGDGVDDLIIP